MKIKSVFRGNRVGRDRRPYARWVYGAWAAFWTLVAGTYTYDVTMGEVVGPAWISWFFLVVAVVYAIGSARIWVQHAGRVVEWETATANRAKLYGRNTPPSIRFDKEN